MTENCSQQSEWLTDCTQPSAWLETVLSTNASKFLVPHQKKKQKTACLEDSNGTQSEYLETPAYHNKRHINNEWRRKEKLRGNDWKLYLFLRRDSQLSGLDVSWEDSIVKQLRCHFSSCLWECFLCHLLPCIEAAAELNYDVSMMSVCVCGSMVSLCGSVVSTFGSVVFMRGSVVFVCGYMVFMRGSVLSARACVCVSRVSTRGFMMPAYFVVLLQT